MNQPHLYSIHYLHQQLIMFKFILEKIIQLEMLKLMKLLVCFNLFAFHFLFSTNMKITIEQEHQFNSKHVQLVHMV